MNKIIAIIPARAGSKRLKGKNMYPLKGKPLIEYTIDAALKSRYLSKNNLYVTTDYQEVKDLCKSKRVNVVDRPDALAQDHIWTQDVIDHAVDTIKNLHPEDILVILQANSPQITSEVIDKCIQRVTREGLWQVHTVDQDLIHNGAIQVMRNKVCSHKGKVNYNGVVLTDWIDVHTIKDIKELEKVI